MVVGFAVTGKAWQLHLYFRCAQRSVALPKQVFFAADKRG
jgi:hypothetical protein